MPVGSIVDTVKELLDQGTREYGDLTSLLLSTQMHGFVYRTGQTPEPVYVSWQDMRCLHQKSPGLTYLGYLQEPVSYTHLDVYKRQVLSVPEGIPVYWKDCEHFLHGGLYGACLLYTSC